MPADGLRGVGVIVTRAAEDAGRLTELLRHKGARVETWPCIEYADAPDRKLLRDTVRRLGSFDWIAATSPRAATRLAAAAGGMVDGFGSPAPVGLPDKVKLAAGGPMTAAAFAAAGWPVHRVASRPGAQGLVEAFALAGDAEGAKVLFACGSRALPTLADGLSRLGASVESVVAYRTLELIPEPRLMRQAIESDDMRIITFASPSAVSGFLGGAIAAGVDATTRFSAAAIGPTTAAALAASGWACTVATDATLHGLVDAVERALANGTTGRRSG